MLNKDFVEKHRQDILGMEVSSDTSTNLTTAQNTIQSIIQYEKNISKEDVIELMKEATKHFQFDEATKQQLIDFCSNAFETIDKDRKYQEEMLKRAERETTKASIFPAIDYRENCGMIYGIRSYDEEGNEQTYIGLGNKKVYEVKSAKKFGIVLSHQENIESNLSLSNFANYVEGKIVFANKLFEKIKKIFTQFVVVKSEFLDVIVTYIMMTYIYILFQVIPYLWINGERGTGKSTIMKLMNKLCFNSMFCTNVNPANIFRQIDNDGSTIILDEFEKMYGDDKQEIIKLLNQGFNIDGVVPRCVGQNNKIKKFRSFSPKIMGGISNIDDVLAERVISYKTAKVKDVKITKYRENETTKRTISNIVDELYIFGFLYAQKIKAIYDNAEINFQGYTLREDDLWNPLLCIAKVIDEENENTQITDNLLKYAKELSKEKFKRNLENEPRLQLLYILYEYLEAKFGANVEVLSDKRKAVEINSLYTFVTLRDEMEWIKNSSTLGKKLTQWYGFSKKREIGKSERDKKLQIKRTYYIFTKEDILKIMEDNHIKLEDYEQTT